MGGEVGNEAVVDVGPCWGEVRAGWVFGADELRAGGADVGVVAGVLISIIVVSELDGSGDECWEGMW